MKKTVRLTESNLRRIVKESVNKTLNELHGPKIYDDDGYDYDGFDEDGYDEDGYDREGWNRNGVHVNGYNREQYADRQTSHKAAKDALVGSSNQLKKNIDNYLDILRNLSKINKYVDLNEKNTYFSVLYNELREVSITLTDVIDFLNDSTMGGY